MRLIFDRGIFIDRRGIIIKTIERRHGPSDDYTSQKQMLHTEARPTGLFGLSISFSAPHAHDSAKEQYFSDPDYALLYEDMAIPPPPLSEDKYFNVLPKEVQEGFNRVRWLGGLIQRRGTGICERILSMTHK